jgi:cell division protein FtsL
MRGQAVLNVALAAALLGSALLLVRSAYETRRLFTALERAQAEARQLEIEHQRLEAERLAQATPLRVEEVARRKLQMRTANPAVTHWVREDGAVVAPAEVLR